MGILIGRHLSLCSHCEWHQWFQDSLLSLRVCNRCVERGYMALETVLCICLAMSIMSSINRHRTILLVPIIHKLILVILVIVLRYNYVCIQYIYIFTGYLQTLLPDIYLWGNKQWFVNSTNVSCSQQMYCFVCNSLIKLME